MDKVLLDNLEILKQFVDQDWDGIVYVGGMEGAGKSVLTLQMAKYLDKSFDLDRCVFTPPQFIEAVERANKKEVIVWDEAQDVFESTRRDKSAMAIKSVLTRIRSKNLFIFIVCPHFWSVNEYLFCSRSRAFIRVFAKKLERGYFEFYGADQKLKLYTIARKYKDLTRVKPDFTGRFSGERVLDWKEYNEKKDSAMLEAAKDEDKKVNKWQHRTKELAKELLKCGYLQEDVGVVIGMSQAQISNIVKD